MTYLDIVADFRAALEVPLCAYHVSGEYAMVKAAAANGWIDGLAVAIEQLTPCDGPAPTRPDVLRPRSRRGTRP